MIPILYESSFVSIQTLWVFVVIALLVASHLAIGRLRRERVTFTLLIEHSTALFIAALFGARLVFFIFHADAYFPGFDFRTLKNFISIWDQGLSFWGATLGAVVMLFYHLKKSDENINKWADALVVPFFVGGMIGNIGAFMGGHSYGIPTNLPWGVLYESANVKYTVPVHPTQLYALALLILLLWSKKILSKQLAKGPHASFFTTSGNTAMYLITGLSLSSFFLEFLRGGDTLLILGARIPMLLYFFSFLVTGWMLRKRYSSARAQPSMPTTTSNITNFEPTSILK